ncbi:MAG TPA: mucoidy inhibitor MuiA family protein [Phycisphaerales bacterium]|nr:mucoidy inhibitor MuiA family protein [Phycisphaerales bacterium]HIB00472.1 mucoidy inhibitor MuiA family protein [Phycisphaerales bacterium]HIB51017.1 mucoidy inhibitor MuiA family protein [Phycisphaerales bacterium]HIN83343.1 mucoidy inhibitor MuiA family protein [Phycisphaerales bacterium]HIO52874.1 mucoidy inhibitor MuiA family protein [Phycisphaerales bacterium]
MRNHFLSILIAGISIGICLTYGVKGVHAQVSLEMLPSDAHSVISDVTLYRNRASITRTATLDLDAGGHSIFFRDLPDSAYLDSVQARIHGNAKLLSVETSNIPIIEDTSSLVAAINAEIKEAEAKLSLSSSKGKSISLQIEMLKTLIEKATNDKAPPVDIDAFDAQIKFIGTRMQELSASSAENTLEIQELNKLLQYLNQRKRNVTSQRRTQINAIVDIGVNLAGTVEIQLTYLVYNASWTPVYSVRANPKGDKIAIDYDAKLEQKTGENWTDVSLTLSTAQPQQSITPPMPNPWFVNVYIPPTPQPVIRVGSEIRSSVAYSMSDADHSFGLEMDTSEKSVEWASAAASIVGDGPAVSFVLPRTVTVPSNKEDAQTTSIATIETSAEHFLIAVPMLTDRVFIRSEVTNKSGYVLLPGTASIFHGSDYVGKTSMKTISPNETFSLDLGIAPKVTSTRTLVEKTTSSTGLFGSGIQTMYDYRISISNGEDSTIDIHVYDRIPVSQNEEIEVLVKNLSSPLSTDATYVSTNQQQGILRWDLSIPANQTGDQSFTMTWQVEIARGKDVKLTPLPE